MEFIGVVTSAGFISNFSLMVIISAFMEFTDNQKVLGGVLIKRLSGVRGSVFASWMIICGVLGAVENTLGHTSFDAAFAGFISIVIGFMISLLISILKIFCCRRQKEELK